MVYFLYNGFASNCGKALEDKTLSKSQRAGKPPDQLGPGRSGPLVISLVVISNIARGSRTPKKPKDYTHANPYGISHRCARKPTNGYSKIESQGVVKTIRVKRAK